MKTMLARLLILTAVLGLGVSAVSAHGDRKQAGPNGGRILTSVEPRAELWVTKDRKVQITFLDAQGKPVAPAGQSVTVTTGSRQSPTVLTFRRQGDVLLSAAELPAGNNLPAVIQLRPAPGAKELVERLHLNLTVCGECRHAEYACTCEGD